MQQARPVSRIETVNMTDIPKQAGIAERVLDDRPDGLNVDTTGRGMNGLSFRGQGRGAWSSGSKQRVMAAVEVAGVMSELSTVSTVVLSDAPVGVAELAEVSGLMLNAGAVMVDSVISEELDSIPISVMIIVFVTVITMYGFDRLSGLLNAEKADRGSFTVFATPGAADVEKQPRPIGTKSRQAGTFGGQHCGSEEKVFVQFGEM